MDDSKYFHKDTGKCADCPDATHAALVALAVCAVAVLLSWAVWRTYSAPPPRLRAVSRVLHWIDAWLLAVGWTKMKIGIAFYQCAALLHKTYDVTMPPEYTRWMSAFEWVELDWTGIAWRPGRMQFAAEASASSSHSHSALWSWWSWL